MYTRGFGHYTDSESAQPFSLGKTQSFSCVPGGIRTLDVWISSPTLKPLSQPVAPFSLLNRLSATGGTDWNRTHIQTDRTCCFLVFVCFSGCVVWIVTDIPTFQLRGVLIVFFPSPFLKHYPPRKADLGKKVGVETEKVIAGRG